MINKGIRYITLITLCCITSIANAAIFDYLSLANGNERGYITFTHTVDGIQANATGRSADGSTAYFAYMDSGNAGLGVCQALTSSNQCTPSSDDNVTYLESLILTFDQEVNIESISFINGDHGTNFLGDFNLAIDDSTAETFSLAHTFSTVITGTEFIFTNLNSLGDSARSNEYQFYISAMDVSVITPTTSSVVPVPAAAWLFASGLLGLVGVARRRKIK